MEKVEGKLLINENQIRCLPKVLDWQDAVKQACAPLIEQKMITPAYCDAIILMVQEKGSYMNVSPQVVLLHAHEPSGVLANGISLLKLDHPIAFNDDLERRASLFFVLASQSNYYHLKQLQWVSQRIQGNQVDILREKHSPHDIAQYLQRN